MKKGDRVTLYLPMIPELPIAMLACARIGAIHSVVFGGFSAESLRDRINDQGAKVLVTADGGWRRGNVVPLKQIADEALAATPTIENVVVVRRTGTPVRFDEKREHWWHRLMEDAPIACKPEKMDAEDPLYILYTSGTTGKPKGILHTTAGYLVGVYATSRWIFDLKEEDVYWCTADIGWVTGHSYVVYGPLANGATCLIYEGAPDTPTRGRFWDLIERHGVTILYTAPTAIRAFMKWGTEWPAKHDLSRCGCSAASATDQSRSVDVVPEKRRAREMPGRRHWWQTETALIDLAPSRRDEDAARLRDAGVPGVEAKILDLAGKEVKVGGGYLAITRPWPAMLRTIWGDDERYVQTYWSKWGKGVYFPGDGAKRDKDGFFWLLGRVDDVMNVAGHRIGTMEVESALVDHPAVAEAAVVGVADDLKGTAIAAFVILKEKGRTSSAAGMRSGETVRARREEDRAIAKPDRLFFVADLPKTRSSKIMRRLLGTSRRAAC